MSNLRSSNFTPIFRSILYTAGVVLVCDVCEGGEGELLIMNSYYVMLCGKNIMICIMAMVRRIVSMQV